MNGPDLAWAGPACYPNLVGSVESSLERAARERGAALMGIVNTTPDSFYDGGRYLAQTAAVARVDELVDQGADILDIGGESSRPGSEPVPPREQISRIEAALGRAVELGRALVSVDTASPEVADYALSRGADLINDVSCLADEGLAAVVAERQAILILMHSRGPMARMSGYSTYPEQGYRDVVEDVMREWCQARDRAVSKGLDAGRVYFDPGLGFNKSARHSFTLLARLGHFARLGVPCVVGPSRKSFISSVDGSGPEERLGGTVAACLLSVQRGARVLRVHDVPAVRQALLVARATEELERGGDA